MSGQRQANIAVILVKTVSMVAKLLQSEEHPEYDFGNNNFNGGNIIAV